MRRTGVLLIFIGLLTAMGTAHLHDEYDITMSCPAPDVCDRSVSFSLADQSIVPCSSVDGKHCVNLAQRPDNITASVDNRIIDIRYTTGTTTPMIETPSEMNFFVSKNVVEEEELHRTSGCWKTTVNDGGHGFYRVSWIQLDAWYCHHPPLFLMSPGYQKPIDIRPILLVFGVLTATVIGVVFRRFRGDPEGS